jgi:hypothetical protein
MGEVLGLRELGGDDAEEVGAVVAPDEVVAPGDEPADDADAVGEQGWRRRAAAGVVIALLVGVGYILTVGRPPGEGRPGIAEAPAGPAVESVESVESATRAALDAWARFADGGDVDQLGDVFDREGPQLARLRAEAAGVAGRSAGGAPYSFRATGMRVGAGSNEEERVVAADVVVSRPGETDQRFAWELVMRKSEGRWRLWTVRERAARGGVGLGGRP